MAHASFDWSDPLALDAQLSADERAIRDAAYARALDAFRHQTRRLLAQRRENLDLQQPERLGPQRQGVRQG